MAKYDYGTLNNNQIKEVQQIQKEMKSYNNSKGITTADSKPRNVEGIITKEHMQSGFDVAKNVFKFFIG